MGARFVAIIFFCSLWSREVGERVFEGQVSERVFKGQVSERVFERQKEKRPRILKADQRG